MRRWRRSGGSGRGAASPPDRGRADGPGRPDDERRAGVVVLHNQGPGPTQERGCDAGVRQSRAQPAAIKHTIDYQLREIIDSRGLTAYAVARLADIDPGIVARWMNGVRSMSFESAERIAFALNLRLVETLRGRAKPQVPSAVVRRRRGGGRGIRRRRAGRLR